MTGPASTRLRALIVDDEPPARDRLRDLLGDEQDIRVIGECGNGAEAVETIEREAPDLVFLDVQIPVLDGFQVLERVAPVRLPGIIFVTAYDQYALRAFEVHALDYLLKPFSRERLREAVDVARARLATDAPADAGILALLDAMRVARAAHDRITVRVDGRLLVFRTGDIDRVEAAANYVRLYVHGAEPVVVRESMKSMETRLPADLFVRIHRSSIVNVDRIRELQPWFHGEHVVILRDGTKLIASRAYLDRLHAAIG